MTVTSFQKSEIIKPKVRGFMGRRIAKEIKDEIIGKIQAGKRVADLAEQYGVSAKTFYKR